MTKHSIDFGGERGRVGGKGRGNWVDSRSVTEESVEFLSLCLCVRVCV